ncbi:GNAT family N-acetyltransferase [Roseomonas xinghualingensis]|uniref:GNAT family N-acetyltransferase n=1 Tax=Roseomonas xinghualingensis TaxID=2986475 RepID=UPI0021F16829|nr:GNAT family N-acetyltransferase [Roseomonas sp. SXEYE001]MCV4209601.1 GNAT family N-acetyltransferase [Roseomonas sp. SXEYE001]
MREEDLPAVSAIAAAVHPGYPESDAVFAERLRLAPETCLLLEMAGAAAGYVLAHPWYRGRPPALDSLIGVLPSAPEVLYLHDIALLPAARGTGAGREAVRLVGNRARGLPMALVAVGGASGFWEGQGFRRMRDEGFDALPPGYGPDALYMEKPFPG